MNIDMADFRQEFDDLFLPELQQLIDDAGLILDHHETKKYTDYLIKIASSGKRIRPYNTALTYSLYSGKDWRSIKHTIIGIELIHLMALIHDDIMDDSETRHGVTSVHAFVKNDLENQTSPNIADHTSRSLAILLGDLVFGWAYASFTKDNQTQESWNIIHSMIQEVVLGQMMDVYNPIETETTIKKIERKMLLKTARYTFTRPLLLGAVCADIKKEKCNWILNFGDSVGLLFQMQDDIFDITKDAVVLKKDPLGDIKNGIHTILSTEALQHATHKEKELWSSWFGNKHLNNQEEIKLFFTTTGAFAFAEEFIIQKEKAALSALSESDLNTEDNEHIKALLSLITKRKY